MLKMLQGFYLYIYIKTAFWLVIVFYLYILVDAA